MSNSTRRIEISILQPHSDYPYGQIIAREHTNGEGARLFDGRITPSDIDALCDTLKQHLKNKI
jgi:hypothetical protein